MRGRRILKGNRSWILDERLARDLYHGETVLLRQLVVGLEAILENKCGCEC